MSANSDPEKIVREIKRKTRRLFSAEEKILTLCKIPSITHSSQAQCLDRTTDLPLLGNCAD